MQTAVPESLMLAIVSILCAVFVVLINSLARTGLKEGNIVNSSATKVVTDFCNYDISRLSGKTVSGSEVVRIVERYSSSINVSYKYLDDAGHSVSQDNVRSTGYFDIDSWYKISLAFDKNDNVEKITIIQTDLE